MAIIMAIRIVIPKASMSWTTGRPARVERTVNMRRWYAERTTSRTIDGWSRRLRQPKVVDGVAF